MNEPHKSVGAIFDAAIELPPERRAAYVQEDCAKDDALRQRVEALLRAHESAEAFMASPAVAPRAETVVVEPAEQPGDRIGRYKLLQQIGEGGCGVVYMAEQEEPVRRRVALKIIRLGMDTKNVIARFEAERQALALMDHPNIAKVFDAGATETGRPFFVMELVRGVRITEYCDQNNLSTEERLLLFAQVCQAIQHAHQKGVIHRDIKPSNILVADHDGVLVPKLIDFGIAKATTDQRLTDKTLFTAFAQFIGTPAYMSPEQAKLSGLDIDTRTDIYSLGVLLYELLTGKTPMDQTELLEAGLDEMRRTIQETEPARPSTRLSAMRQDELTTTARHRRIEPPKLIHLLRGDLDWIVMKALEKDRRRRYATANGLASDIQRHLDCETVLARPPSAAYRLQKRVRRNKLAFSAIGVVACALVLGVTVSTWQAVRATKAEHAEKAQAASLRRKAYAAEVNVAFQALAENNLARAVDLLNRQRPKAGEEDPRGFEWRLLWQHCQPDQKVTFRDAGAWRGVAFSPDGKWLAYAGDEIVIRALPSQDEVTTIPFSGGLGTLAFSPRARVLAVGQDTEVRIWSTESWEEERTLPGARSPALFSPDGQWLVTGAPGPVAGVPGGYRVWKTETWQMESFFGVEPDPLWLARNAMAFSPDGSLLVTAGHPDEQQSGNRFQIWDFPSLTVRSNFARFPGGFVCAGFAPDGKHLLTGTGEGELLVWNIAEGRIVDRLKEHTSCITAITPGRDGRTFATASTDRTLVLWEAAPRKPLARFRGHLGQVWSVDMSPDGRMLASAALDGTTKLWDAAKRHGQRELSECFLIAGFSSDSRRLVGVGSAQSKLWNLENGAIATIPLQGTQKPPSRGEYRSLRASRDVQGTEPKAVCVQADGVVELWDLATMSRLCSWQADDEDVTVAALSPDGQFIATGNATGNMVLWKAGTRDEVRRFETLGVSGKLMSLTFSSDGRLLAGSEDQNQQDSHVGVWDVNTGAVMRKLPVGAGSLVLSLVFSPDRKLLATAEQNETVRLWDIASGALRVTLKGHAQTVVSVAFTADGKTLATGGADSKVKLWNIATEQEVVTLELPGGCRSVRFSPDGRTLAVGFLLEPEQRIRLWEVPSFQEIDAAEAKKEAEIKQL